MLIHVKTFQSDVYNDWNSGVTYHAISLISLKKPHRKTALLFRNMKHSLGYVALFLGMNQRHQGQAHHER